MGAAVLVRLVEEIEEMVDELLERFFGEFLGEVEERLAMVEGGMVGGFVVIRWLGLCLRRTVRVGYWVLIIVVAMKYGGRNARAYCGVNEGVAVELCV